MKTEYMEVKTYREIQTLLGQQDVYVEFQNMYTVEDDEIPDPKMYGKLLSIVESVEKDCPTLLHMFFDLSGFEDHNKSVALHNWYDDKGDARLTWFEAEKYPADGKVDFYVADTLDTEAEVFRVLNMPCSCCKTTSNLIEQGGITVRLSSNGRIELFVDGKEEARAETAIKRCPFCGRKYSGL